MAKRKPRTRAGGTWTEAQYWGYMRSSLRKAYLYYPSFKIASDCAKIPYVGRNKRRKYSWVCAMCGKQFAYNEVCRHHIIPCGALSCNEHIEPFVLRLTCEPDGIAILCKECHLETHRLLDEKIRGAR